MGNSASSLPYSIGKQVGSNSHQGWTLHEGQRKSDGQTVSVFVAKKPALNKTLAAGNQGNQGGGRSQLTLVQPALHHFSFCKKLRHPHILSVHATLDTDNPNESSSSGGGASGGAAAGPPAAAATAVAGDLIIVTESCVPLDVWLQSNPPLEQVAWGLESVIRALHFLHTSANIAHGCICPESLFVTRSGDVKLWNFALATNVMTASGGLSRHFIDYEGLLTPLPFRAPERQQGLYSDIAANGTHCMDSYSVGMLVSHFYHGSIPGPLVKAVQRLQTHNLRMRPRLQPLLKCPVFDTPHQKLQLQLEEFAAQPVEQKISFWQNLTPSLKAGLTLQSTAVFKLLPLMKQSIETICQSDSIRSQEMYRREVLEIIQPMMYIAEQYLGDQVAKEIGPTVALLFTVNDRGVRGSLLQRVTFFCKHLDDHALNTNVFEPMCSGFSDSSPALRELTLKATLTLVPKLTPPNLEKLSRYLVRLQGDAEPGIRTNTVIFFSHLAPHMTEMSRQKLLLPAFCRSMKDVFTPCRLAALQSTLKARQFFDAAGIASKVLPAVTPCLIDPSADVRKEAFAAVDELLFVLRQESERLSRLPVAAGVDGGVPVLANGAGSALGTGAAAATTRPSGIAPAPASAGAPTTNTNPSAAASSGSGGGYFSSWLTSSTKSSASAAAAAIQQSPQPSAASSVNTRMPYYVGAPALPMAHLSLGTNSSSHHNNAVPVANTEDDNWNDDDGGIDDDDDGGWGDDDLDISEGAGRRQQSQAAAAAPAVSASVPTRQFAKINNTMDDEDDFFASAALDAKPARPVVMMNTAAKRTTMGGKLAVPGMKKATTTAAAAAPAAAKPAVQKLDAEDLSDNWDDF